ncbi:MAG: hypothetical protein NWQ23_05950 [Yoonia sp.]|uniref:hypothetical protein n=1 Tax=Yoonia sp. TaxID=2212373 RepID=UPI00273F54C0|nr:hypothetical protein [Yoonia sp.]MDP5084946.1 hypothetical protein [Yoonia sp.]MDP5362966.1 hypothetical protein [Paracoccaceae bacterium]
MNLISRCNACGDTPRVSDARRACRNIYADCRIWIIFPLVRRLISLYLRRWDTLPQRRAHICEDTSNGYDQTGSAAG